MGQAAQSSTRRPVLNIRGELVALGPLRRDLVPTYQRWMNDLITARNLGTSTPLTLEAEEAWYEQAAVSPQTVSFTIYELASPRPIGTTQLMGINLRNRRAEFGINIGEHDARRKGYGTEATRLLLDYAFTALGLHNVSLTVADFNPAAIRAYEKAGFREFGRRRECWLMGGKLHDEVHMQCLSTEFTGSLLDHVFSPEKYSASKKRTCVDD